MRRFEATDLSRKDFLFLTARPDLPVALVHFTWTFEPNPMWPFVVPYKSLRDFARRERSWITEVRVRVQRLSKVFVRAW